MSRQSIKAYYSDRIDSYGFIVSGDNDTPLSVRDILIKLKEVGLDIHERKLIFYIAIEGWSTKDMLKKGWINEGSVSYHYRKALRKLREVGFNFR
jgi:hypothetical protein